MAIFNEKIFFVEVFIVDNTDAFWSTNNKWTMWYLLDMICLSGNGKFNRTHSLFRVLCFDKWS